MYLCLSDITSGVLTIREELDRLMDCIQRIRPQAWNIPKQPAGVTHPCYFQGLVGYLTF